MENKIMQDDYYIHRIVLHAKPSIGNKQFELTETASLVILLRVNLQEDPEELLARLLKKHRWTKLKTEQSDIIDPIKSNEIEDEEFKQMFRVACERGDYLYVFPDQFGGGRKGKFPQLRRPDFTEAFYDNIIESIGGRRLTHSERNNEQTLNADYLFGDYVIELKELQESPLDKVEKQEKIAEIFLAELTDTEEIPLDFELLTDLSRRKCFEILGTPIKNALKKASAQIKSTKTTLCRPDSKSAVILVNSGFNFMDPEIFRALAFNYHKKDSQSIDILVCIEIMIRANGFDQDILYGITSNAKEDLFYKEYSERFHIEFREHLTQWIRSGMPGTKPALDPSIGFEQKNHTFYWSPPGKKWVLPPNSGEW